MAIALSLSRGGAKKRPYYRIVAADSRSPRDGKYLEQIGIYNPLLAKDDPARVKIDEDRARYWLGVGAQPSDRVARFLDAAGIRERAARNNPKKGEPGQAAKERAEEKAAKARRGRRSRQGRRSRARRGRGRSRGSRCRAGPRRGRCRSDEAPAEEAAAEEAPAEEAAAEEAPAEEAGEEKAEG